jgi:hypothetical protein
VCWVIRPAHLPDRDPPFRQLSTQRGFNTKRLTIVFFLGHTKPLPSYD